MSDPLSGFGEHLKNSYQEERYEPGTLGYSASDVEALLDEFLSTRLSDVIGEAYAERMVGRDSKEAKRLSGIQYEARIEMPPAQAGLQAAVRYLDDILPKGELHADALLDAVVLAVSQTDYKPKRVITYPQQRNIYLNDLLDPLVQLLYERGHNDFHLDLMILQFDPSSLGGSLCGSKKRPLVLTCQGNFQYFGNHVTDCDLRLLGDMKYNWHGGTGNGAVRSKFSLQGKTSRSIGRNALLCSFTLPTLTHFCRLYKDAPDEEQPVIIDLEDLDSNCKDYQCDTLFRSVSSGRGSTFRVEPPPREEDLAALREAGFFKGFPRRVKRNKLFIPDGEGGWKEVRP